MLDEQTGASKGGYSKEFRRECYEDTVRQKEEQKRRGEENSMFKDYNEFYSDLNEKREVPVYNKNGGVRLANEGKYEWRFDETQDKTCVIFEIKIPKFMDTSCINCDLQPNYVRLDIKGRITQLELPEEVIVEKSKVQRSQTTGWL